ncbi:Phosphatidic acid phosphatase type 2/haloperoxidase [Pseudocohnilembus persalinus]|uniref:Phosphatidic acid phosphatase type 2/haloperoxidase n=1 Tax=Pseudocohnilembus persalinus TaxID=266149 RepID=A0A0V0Q8L0_PSEPJ|nr:Phosphatidic acid phosphatase type 2/haloperoxidase [Pseudocohnilembus persalinus]|eukprot:KRW98595.1 Phosphatidic acid phosphatase type 2/haloperoxidase [Pseudocohnilembus persalinus]
MEQQQSQINNQEEQEGFIQDQEFYRNNIVPNQPPQVKEKQRPKFKVWFNWLAAALTGGFLFIFRIVGIPALSVPCLVDRGHELTDQLNRICNDNIDFAHGITLISSLSIDIIVISSVVYWLAKARSLRLPISIALFYVIRTPHLFLYTPKFPQGFFFEYPGFPSLFVPYGRQSDFFFSGHTGFMTLVFLEWRTIGFKKMQYITGILLLYVMFSLIVLRVHYTIDVTTGLLMAHYVYLVVLNYENEINLKALQAQSWIVNRFKKSKKNE